MGMESGKRKLANIAMLLGHVWGTKSLSLSLLKPVDIERFGEGGLLFMRLAMRCVG